MTRRGFIARIATSVAGVFGLASVWWRDKPPHVLSGVKNSPMQQLATSTVDGPVVWLDDSTPYAFIVTQEDGQFTAECMQWDVVSCGDTYDEAIANVSDAVSVYIETVANEVRRG